MKKIAITLAVLSTMILTGCFGGDEAPKEETVQGGIYKTADFEISYSDSWELFQKKDFTSDVSANTEVVLRSKRKNEAFIANISIVKNPIPDGVNAKDYAKRAAQSDRAILENFKELDSEENDNGAVYFFQGKRTATEPIVNFIQNIVVKEKIAYIGTAAFITNEDEQVAKDAQSIVRSLKIY